MNEAGLTIAIIELVGGAALQRAIGEAETLAAGRSDIAVVVVRRSEAATVPHRRGLALAACKTGYLALVEDTIRLTPAWIEAGLEGFKAPGVAALWGPIKVAQELPSRARALGRMEYGRYGQCGSEGSGAEGLPGACMMFRAAALGQALDGETGIIEHEVAVRLRSAGHEIRCNPALQVEYCETDDYGARLSTRFGHGRLYASARLVAAGFAARGLAALKAVLLPAVLTVRALRTGGNSSSGSAGFGVIFWVMAMASAWALGEFVGAVFGGGDSAGTWR